MTAATDVNGGFVVIAVHGPWGGTLWRAVARTLKKCFSGHPDELIIDVTALTDPTGASAMTWMTAHRAGAGMWPPVRVAVSGVSGTLASRLDRLGAKWSLPIFDSVAQAHDALASGLPMGDRQQVRLPPELSSADVARDLVALACRAWGLAHLAARSETVVRELVIDSATRAGTEIQLTVARRGTGLYLSVRDRGPWPPPVMDNPDSLQAGTPGRGMRLVAGNATAWGALTAHDGGGTIVWATVRARPTESG